MIHDDDLAAHVAAPIAVHIDGAWAVVERPYLECERGDCQAEMFTSCVECGGSFCLGHMAPDPDVEFLLCAACYAARQKAARREFR